MHTHLKTAASLWLSSKKSQVKPATYAKYTGILTNHILSYFGETELRRIREKEIYAFTEHLSEAQHLSAKTVRDILSVLKMLLRFSARRGFCKPLRLEDIQIKCPPPKPRVFTKEEQERLEQLVFSDLQPRFIGILISLYTGLRIGELCALKWADVGGDTLSVRKTLQRVQTFASEKSAPKTRIVIETPKSLCSVREIPLPDFLIPILKKFRTENAYVLTGRKTHTEPRAYSNLFRRCLEQCGIQNASFHTLRHTFATRCIESGMDVKSLSEILGHASVQITLNRYVHSSMEFKRRQMQKLAPPLFSHSVLL